MSPRSGKPAAVLAAALIMGALHGLAFAPRPLPAWALPALQLLTFAGLCLLIGRTATVKRAIWTGASFGLGNFVVGISWIYISLHEFAFMAAPLAAMGVGLLAAYLSIFPALASGLARWLVSRPLTAGQGAGLASPLVCALAMATAWTCAEWLRGVLFTGFPWLNVGYAHVDGPLHGWASLVGVYGLAFTATLTAAALAAVCGQAFIPRPAGKAVRQLMLPLGLAAVLLLGGVLAANWTWVRPHGEPLAVRLVQANIPLSEKFDPDQIWTGMELHRKLSEEPRSDGQAHTLTLLPETAVPIFQDQLTVGAWQEWVDSAARNSSTYILGAAMRDSRPDRDYYYNSVISLNANTSAIALEAGQAEQRYDKRHLVPFGEFVPPGFRWFVNAMIMPLGDFDRGAPRQTPFLVGDQHIALNICYEDVFGEELLPAIRPGKHDPGATLLANVSNLAWFGNSLALPQHLQMSRMRVRETGRPMLRATNTGMTAVINAQAQVVRQLRPLTLGVLDTTVQGTTGLTPYTRTGNTPILVLLAALLGLLAWRRLAGKNP